MLNVFGDIYLVSDGMESKTHAFLGVLGWDNCGYSDTLRTAATNDSGRISLQRLTRVVATANVGRVCSSEYTTKSTRHRNMATHSRELQHASPPPPSQSFGLLQLQIRVSAPAHDPHKRTKTIHISGDGGATEHRSMAKAHENRQPAVLRLRSGHK